MGEKGIRRGISHAIYRYEKTNNNNKDMKDSTIIVLNNYSTIQQLLY